MKKILITTFALALLFLAYNFSHLFLNSSDQQLKSEITNYLESASKITDCDCSDRSVYIQKFRETYYITIIDKDIKDDSVKSLKRKFTIQRDEKSYSIESEKSSSICRRDKVWLGINAGMCK